MCKQVHNPLYVLSAFHVFLPPSAALFSRQQLRTPQSQEQKQDTIWNRHALLIPTRLYGLLEWGALPALFHSEGLEGQLCHYACTTAYMTLLSTNAHESAWPRQIRWKVHKVSAEQMKKSFCLYFMLFTAQQGVHRYSRFSENIIALFCIFQLITRFVLGKY